MKAKHSKTLERVFEAPTRSDVRWSDIEALLDALGATLSEGRGSRVRVDLPGAPPSVFHRPHPEKETNRATLKDVRRLLSEAGVEP